ncbi:MAG: amino acid permease [Bacteroidota bacterium]
MPSVNNTNSARRFGTAPVFITAISTILGAILFLRFGYAVGTIGFMGSLLLIILGHLITVPTALAISELSTNTRVEGGGEYFIISRSFGLNIGATIGIALFLSQAISIAFYIIAFTETFQMFFEWVSSQYGMKLPRQVISIPVLLILAVLILRKGANLGVGMLYGVAGILFLSLLLFFLGSGEPEVTAGNHFSSNFGFSNRDAFFTVFAICFPAFTGMTAGVGLSGDLKQPGKSLPLGTMGATIAGMLVYILVVWKMAASASTETLLTNQLVMTQIAIGGSIFVLLGLAASTISSALGSVLVAPRTLQALAGDKSFPFQRINTILSRGKGKTNEPANASLVAFVIAFIFVALGNVDAVAEIISMFFLITYGSLCLISFLNHFGSSPAYRPRFRSKWYFSLIGFVLSVWVMFMINAVYTVVAYLVIIAVYLVIEHYNKDRKGLVNLFKGVLFQLNRKLQVYMQKNQGNQEAEEWRPAAVCISSRSFEREKVFDLMNWIAYRHGFGTYFHFIEDYFSRQSYQASRDILRHLIDVQKEEESTLYIDTMISPSYTSAIAQIIQAPSISGMENNMVVFEYDKEQPEELERIISNISLAKAGEYDVCVYGMSKAATKFRNGIHVWIRPVDHLNANLMILLGYIILAHPDWSRSEIKIFSICAPEQVRQTREELKNLVEEGRLPITLSNIEIVPASGNQAVYEIIKEKSAKAGLTIIGFREEHIKRRGPEYFTDFSQMEDVLFVNASRAKEIVEKG